MAVFGFVAVWLLVVVGSIWAGHRVGKSKGRANLGLAFGLFFGPIGVVVMYLLPDRFRTRGPSGPPPDEDSEAGIKAKYDRGEISDAEYSRQVVS